jgi:pyridoxamine 5'-phosphate oxidase
MRKKLADIRREYTQMALSKKDVLSNPLKQFDKWFEEALDSKIWEPTAMSLSTAGNKGEVSSRIVLLKHFDEQGFVFYSNYKSRKAIQIKDNNNVALLFFWPELERQIRIEGKTKKLAEHLSDQYFDSRPDSSKIGAWASKQSTKIPDRKYLEKQKADFEKKFRNQKVQRPDYWGGYLVIPYRYEFWQGRENRLHDRIEYQKENNNWKINRLAP